MTTLLSLAPCAGAFLGHLGSASPSMSRRLTLAPVHPAAPCHWWQSCNRAIVQSMAINAIVQSMQSCNQWQSMAINERPVPYVGASPHTPVTRALRARSPSLRVVVVSRSGSGNNSALTSFGLAPRVVERCHARPCDIRDIKLFRFFPVLPFWSLTTCALSLLARHLTPALPPPFGHFGLAPPRALGHFGRARLTPCHAVSR
jgi:hypothetical protein